MFKSGFGKKAWLFILLALAAAMLFGACGRTADIDTANMYLVVYDGNGGYLGNKTATVRKLYCSPDSKIPNYPVSYTETEYIVSSLGLAMRAGYQLLGWYANADYTENPSGEYLYLSTDDGNGAYRLNSAGEYVQKYVASEDGRFIFVYVDELGQEDPEAAPNTYVFIDATREEGEDPLPIESGFHKCNGEEDISEIADDAVREAYRAAYETKAYSAAEVSGLAGYQLYEELPEEYRTLFAALTKYEFSYAKAEEGDETLDHYELVSDYAYIDNIFEENENGLYVQSGMNYVKRDGGDGAVRYSVSSGYLFSADSTENMTRYNAAMEYWKFKEDRVTADKCTWDGEKYVMTLYAHWVKKNTVYYHYENGTGQVDEATQKLLPDNISYVSIRPGDTIGKKEIVPKKGGYTFVGWSKSETEMDLWDFENDVFPEESNELHLYAYYIEGDYTRITSVKGLSKIGEKPDGKYLIASDIDFSGATIDKSPLGLSEAKPFTGEILSYGNRIRNFTFALKGKKSQAMGTGEVVQGILIPVSDGAVIRGFDVEFNVVMTGFSGKGIDSGATQELLFEISGLIGRAEGETTSVEDCAVKYTVASANDTTLAGKGLMYVITTADYVVSGKAVRLKNCTSEIDVTGLKGNVDVREVRSAE